MIPVFLKLEAINGRFESQEIGVEFFFFLF